jgi:hypothetical protein
VCVWCQRICQVIIICQLAKEDAVIGVAQWKLSVVHSNSPTRKVSRVNFPILSLLAVFLGEASYLLDCSDKIDDSFLHV